jgi:hypothetical protein
VNFEQVEVTSYFLVSQIEVINVFDCLLFDAVLSLGSRIFVAELVQRLVFIQMRHTQKHLLHCRD